MRIIFDDVVVGPFRGITTGKTPFAQFDLGLGRSSARHCHPSLRSDAVDAVRNFNAESGICFLSMNTKKKQIPRAKNARGMTV